MMLAITALDVQAQYLSLQADLDTLSNVTEIDLSVDPAFNLVLADPVQYSDPNLLIGTVSSITSDSNGRVYVADSDQFMIHRFDADGTFLESFGRDGEGPGEFRSLIKLRYRDGTVYALDRNLNRVTAFNTESLDVEATINLSGGAQATGMNARSMPEELFVLPGNRFLLAFSMFASGTNQLYFQPVDIFHPDEGYEGADQLKVPVQQSVMFQNAGSMGVLVPPYGRNGTLYATDDGTIYTNWSENMLIKEYNKNGDYTGAWFDVVEKLPLTRQQLRESYSDRYMEILSDEELPDTWPAIRSFLVDDLNRFWIERYTENLSESEWIIASKEGRQLGRIILPAEDNIHLVHRNSVYIRERDSDGFEIVKRYRLVLE